MGQPGYTLPWGTQISAAATTQARLTEARQCEQRASEEQSILLREGADMVRYYERRADRAVCYSGDALLAQFGFPFDSDRELIGEAYPWLATLRVRLLVRQSLAVCQTSV